MKNSELVWTRLFTKLRKTTEERSNKEKKFEKIPNRKYLIEFKNLNYTVEGLTNIMANQELVFLKTCNVYYTQINKITILKSE